MAKQQAKKWLLAMYLMVSKNNNFKKQKRLMRYMKMKKSEKMAIGHEFDGKVSLVVGTHTHIPTADAHILNNGTAYISDLGMCGDYDSIIGLDKNKSLEKFKKKIPISGISPASGEASISGVFVETNDESGLAMSIKLIIVGGKLQSTWS